MMKRIWMRPCRRRSPRATASRGRRGPPGRAWGPAPKNSPAGPVINDRAKQTILNYIQIGMKEGRLAAGGEPADGNGHYIQPTVFADVDFRARIAQEEIFGPVVAVIKARDFESALEIANSTEYGLTGAVFTKNPE